MPPTLADFFKNDTLFILDSSIENLVHGKLIEETVDLQDVPIKCYDFWKTLNDLFYVNAQGLFNLIMNEEFNVWFFI